MMRRILWPIVLLAMALPGWSQNYIGMHKDAVAEAMRREHPRFGFVREVNTGRKHYLKYENTHDEETLLFMLNETKHCIAVSRMYNVWMFRQIKSELDQRYRAKGNLEWEELRDGQRYEITLRRREWFITVTTRPLGNRSRGI